MGAPNNPNAVKFREDVDSGKVQSMIDTGYTYSQIARYYRISRQTLYNHFPKQVVKLPDLTTDGEVEQTLSNLRG
jgi:DNA invertase Pin-like site-specific DNA recombinase